MTREELIEKCTLKFNRLPLPEVNAAVRVILESMSQALEDGRRIEVRGFGSFEVRETKAKIGRNPKSGKAVQIAASHKPHFKPGKELRERVNSTQ